MCKGSLHRKGKTCLILASDPRQRVGDESRVRLKGLKGALWRFAWHGRGGRVGLACSRTWSERGAEGRLALERSIPWEITRPKSEPGLSRRCPGRVWGPEIR